MKDNVIHVNFGSQKPKQAPVVSESAAEKLKKFDELVRQGVVMVTLDTRREGVKVPPDFLGTPALNLNFSTLFKVPDFVYDEIGLRATLEFPKGHFTCEIPWHAIYAMHPESGEDSVIWPADVPSELHRR